MGLKDLILASIPKRFELMCRYNYNRIIGRLDPELRLIGKIVARRRRCVDVGANVGLYTYRFAQLFDAVEAFEPIHCCAQTIISSKLRNVRVHNSALSNRAGKGTLSVPPGRGQERFALASAFNRFPSGDSVIVDLEVLDSFDFLDVDLIKIDVEGHEVEVLQGALQTIRADFPVLLLEIEQRHHADRSIHEIFDFILNLGYSGYFYSDCRLRPLGEFSVMCHQEPKNLCTRKYVNNFLFRPAKCAALR
jgi:FkbM family methyltransferase